MPVLTPTPEVNAAVAKAAGYIDFVNNIAKVNPDLVAQLETKPLAYSRTPWGVLAAYGIGVAAARYGFNLDPTMTQVMGGCFVMAGAYGMRAITKQPIAGVVATPAGTPPDPAVMK